MSSHANDLKKEIIRRIEFKVRHHWEKTGETPKSSRPIEGSGIMNGEANVLAGSLMGVKVGFHQWNELPGLDIPFLEEVEQAIEKFSRNTPTSPQES